MLSAQSIANAAYRRTPKGCLQRAYEFAARRIKKGGSEPRYACYEGKGICTREQFYEAFLDNPKFKKLHKLWADGGYQKGQRPTPDRMDTDYGYEIWNIVWETYNVNTLRALPH